MKKEGWRFIMRRENGRYVFVCFYFTLSGTEDKDKLQNSPNDRVIDNGRKGFYNRL